MAEAIKAAGERGVWSPELSPSRDKDLQQSSGDYIKMNEE